jgi:hypothetical protein
MSYSQKIKRVWTDNTSTYSFEVVQVGASRGGTNAAVADGTVAEGHAVAITQATLQLLWISSSQAVTLQFNGGDAIQTMTPGGSIDPTDHFTLSWGGQTTGAIIFSATSAAAIQAALQALSSIGAGNVAVTGPNAGPWVVEFTGTLALGARATITTIIATVASAVMPITVTQAGSASTQTLAIKAGVPQDWTKDDAFANPLTGNVTRVAITNASGATAQVNIEALFN